MNNVSDTDYILKMLDVHSRMSFEEGHSGYANTMRGAANEISRLREQVRVLREAISSSLNELEWYVSRKKDLGDVDQDGNMWADLLDTDLNILRAALEATHD